MVCLFNEFSFRRFYFEWIWQRISRNTLNTIFHLERTDSFQFFFFFSKVIIFKCASISWIHWRKIIHIFENSWMEFIFNHLILCYVRKWIITKFQNIEFITYKSKMRCLKILKYFVIPTVSIEFVYEVFKWSDL